MNKIAVVSMVKNEEDIIESFVRHTCKFADKMYICDHKSTDGTRKIIEALAEELPIEISTYDKDEKNQVGVTNNLISRALDEKFDIILPLDADEFVIKKDGDSKNLREYLQNLNIDKCYRVLMQDHRFVDNDTEKFALSRSSVQVETKVGTMKIIIGREFFLKNHLRISPGNHDLITADQKSLLSQDPEEKIVPHDPKIFYAHFALRSPEQKISKYMQAWLNTQLIGTQYTTLDVHGKKFVNEYLKDESAAKIDLTGFFPAKYLGPYKNECNLDKNGGGMKINPLRNIFMLAENFSRTLNYERILSKQKIVRIFVFYDGDAERAKKSIESALNQTYPHKKIYLALLTTENISELLKILGSQISEIEFVDKSELRAEIFKPNGSYLQFILPGDILLPDKIKNCVVFANSTTRPAVICSELTEKSTAELFPTVPKYQNYDEIYGVLTAQGKELLQSMSSKSMFFKSWMSRIFFVQSIFSQAYWLDMWLQTMNLKNNNLESHSIFFISNAILNSHMHIFDEKLVERGCKPWTEKDLEYFKNISKDISTQIK